MGRTGGHHTHQQATTRRSSPMTVRQWRFSALEDPFTLPCRGRRAARGEVISLIFSSSWNLSIVSSCINKKGEREKEKETGFSSSSLPRWRRNKHKQGPARQRGKWGHISTVSNIIKKCLFSLKLLVLRCRSIFFFFFFYSVGPRLNIKKRRERERKVFSSLIPRGLCTWKSGGLFHFEQVLIRR